MIKVCMKTELIHNNFLTIIRTITQKQTQEIKWEEKRENIEKKERKE